MRIENSSCIFVVIAIEGVRHRRIGPQADVQCLELRGTRCVPYEGLTGSYFAAPPPAILRLRATAERHMKEAVVAKALPTDSLNREKFLISLERHISAIAKTPSEHLPAPRVLAVDAAWGTGKSWVASKLCERLQGPGATRPIAFIDAFRHDHHHEVFAVIAAAIMQALKPKAGDKKKFLTATGSVMKVALPAATKMIGKAVANKLGADSEVMGELVAEVKDALDESAGRWTNAAVDALLKRYASTQETQDKFISTLSSLTVELPTPFVVLIDELDRCRPSFALEVLEQIKHLFSAKNVVFVLFWNSASIHESIRHTYGTNTNAFAYLSKFICLSIPLTADSATDRYYGRYSTFITEVMNREELSLGDTANTSLGLFAEVLDATVRDVEKAIRYFALVPPQLFGRRLSMVDFAFVAMVRSVDEQEFKGLLAREAETFNRLAEMLSPYRDKQTMCREMWAVCMYLSDEEHYRPLLSKAAAVDGADIDNQVISEFRHSGNASRPDWLMDAARALLDGITQRAT